MDNSNLSRNRQNDHLGVNKMGKNIKKSPFNQPNFANPARQQPQPQVYNINKNDFRNIVQQLTGSPSQDPLPRPPQPPKPPSMRLQKIRPPPLTPINRPHMPIHPPPLERERAPPPPAVAVPYGNSVPRPAQFVQPSPTMLPPMTHGDSVWANTAESPISAYMRYLQNSIINSGPRQTQPQPPSPGLLPYPYPPPLPSPRMNGPPPLLPSPTSQYLLQSPSGFLNLLSPRSPYPLLSPGYQFPPLTPNFSFSPMAQSGILGPGPQPPPSPGSAFPLSPSGFFPMSSPRWRDQ